MTQLLLQHRIEFAGLSAFNYTHIQIKGRGIIVQERDRDEAKDLIEDQNLKFAPFKDYADPSAYQYGRIYTDDKFKEFVNSHPTIKSALVYLLEQLDK